MEATMKQNDVEVIDAAGATATLQAARKYVRDCEKQLRAAHMAVHRALTARAMVDALDFHDIPKSHRPRLIVEMTALGKGADFIEHVRDYRAAFIDSNVGEA